MNAQDPLDRLEIKSPRLRFWHVLLAGFGASFVVFLAVGVWHWARVSRQVRLVATVKQSGGYVSYYHDWRRLPDGDFVRGQGSSLFPEGMRQKLPNLCSQVFGASLYLEGSNEDRHVQVDETERFFRAARRFPKLKAFTVVSNHFPGRRVADLESFRGLQHLSLSGDQIIDEDIPVLVQAAELRELLLDSQHLTDAALPPLVSLTKLKRVSLASPLLTNAGLARLKLPEHLEGLWLDLPAVSDEGLCALPNLPRLKELHLEMPVGDAAIAHLTQGGQLERFVATKAGFGDEGLAAIARNQQIWNSLDLSGTAVTNDGLRHLGSLQFLGAINLENTDVSDTGLAHVASMLNLTRLVVSKTKVTGEGLKDLHGLKHLREIHLSDCPISDVGLDALHGFKQLREINLSGTPITNDSCRRIPKTLIDYSSLDLSRTKLTDECVPFLMPTTISKICLDDTGLTDAGLLTIAADEGELQELSVRGTKITAKGVLDFFDRLEARGRTCKLSHDIPYEEIGALEEARMASDATSAEPPADGGAVPE